MNVVRKAYQRHVLGNLLAAVLDGRKSSKGNDIVKCQDGVRAVIAFQQVHRVLQRRLVVNLVTHHQVAVYANPVVAQRLQVTVLTAAHHIQMIRTADKGYTPATRFYQVLRGLVGSLVAVSCHRRTAIRQTGSSEEYQRNTHLRQLLEVAVVLRILRQTGYNALHVQTDKVVHRHRLVFEILVAVRTDYAVTCAPRLTLDAVQHGSIVVRHQVRYHHANHFRSLLTQALRKGVRTVVQLLGQVLHALLHILAYFRRTAQGTTHGSDTHAQLVGQVFQRSSVLSVICHRSALLYIVLCSVSATMLCKRCKVT